MIQEAESVESHGDQVATVEPADELRTRPLAGSVQDKSQSDEVEALRQQLDGKNELIAALVGELEQVVEQLDRVKRSGNDRSRSTSMSAALPAEVVEEHQQVIGELQRVVQQWDEMQTSFTLGRIESEIAELRAMMTNGYVRGSTDEVPNGQSSDLESVLSRLSAEPAVDNSDAEPTGSAWDAMKRQMLGDPPVETAGGAGEEDLAELLEGVNVPVPVDLESATVDILRRALADRDVYIVQLIRWVRARRTATIPDNWDEIQGVPDELHDRVETLAARLEEQVRLAEVEMSLERARLSREKSLLQADRAVMDKHLKRLGITSLDELEDIAVSSSSTGDRRWMRFLGVNRKS